MPKIRKKRLVHESVYDLALERLRVAYDIFDTVVVSFSGGKDSTVCLNLTIEVARDLGKLPLHVFHYDEEAIPFETAHYVRRVAQMPEVDLAWYCLPVKHRNGCSRAHPFWYPWAPEVEDKWVRPLPPEAITYGDVRGFPTDVDHRPTMPDSVGLVLPPERFGNVGMVMGIRGDESLTRMRAILMETSEEHYFIKPHILGREKGINAGNLKKVYPIYDWTTPDVWTAPRELGWDYNKAYDRMEEAGISHHAQRCAPPYGEEPMGALWMFACCFPDIWDKMQVRVPGAATAARYAKTEIYSYHKNPEKPDGVTWEQWIMIWVNKHPEKYRAQIARHIRKMMTGHHYLKTTDPIMPTAPHPVTAMSWAFLLMIAVRGDFKTRKYPPMNNDPTVMAARQKKYDAERAQHDGL